MGTTSNTTIAKLKKLVRQLDSKKYRNETLSFVAEGSKNVTELLERFTPLHIVAVEEWLREHQSLCGNALVYEVSPEQLQSVSLQQHPQQVLAVFRIPNDAISSLSLGEGLGVGNTLLLALDGVQDPGNLGTIIRIADWYGIRHIICSLDTANAFNPKTVQATMGSLARVDIHRTDLVQFLDNLPKQMPIMGTTLDGDNINSISFPKHGILIMGNEGKGISQPVRQRLTHRLFIPRYPENSQQPDSLNVAIATAIICAELRK